MSAWVFLGGWNEGRALPVSPHNVHKPWFSRREMRGGKKEKRIASVLMYVC